jgi:hypothetical protein
MIEMPTSELEGYVDLPIAEQFKISPLRHDYATADIRDSFNWEKAMDLARDQRGVDDGQELYLFVFRSRLNIDISSELYKDLLVADHEALEEAKANKNGEQSGLLCYFAGEPDEEGYCLSLCLWTSREAALSRNGKKHGEAMEFAKLAYDEDYTKFERYHISRSQAIAKVEITQFAVAA